MKIAISPAKGLNSRAATNPFQNENPSFSIFAAVSAHAIVQNNPTIANNSHAANVAKCTCGNIPNPPSLPVLLDSGPVPGLQPFSPDQAGEQRREKQKGT
jgi:hypothetical protein